MSECDSDSGRPDRRERERGEKKWLTHTNAHTIECQNTVAHTHTHIVIVYARNLELLIVFK